MKSVNATHFPAARHASHRHPCLFNTPKCHRALVRPLSATSTSRADIPGLKPEPWLGSPQQMGVRNENLQAFPDAGVVRLSGGALKGMGGTRQPFMHSYPHVLKLLHTTAHRRLQS